MFVVFGDFACWIFHTLLCTATTVFLYITSSCSYPVTLADLVLSTTLVCHTKYPEYSNYKQCHLVLSPVQIGCFPFFLYLLNLNSTRAMHECINLKMKRWIYEKCRQGLFPDVLLVYPPTHLNSDHVQTLCVLYIWRKINVETSNSFRQRSLQWR